MKNKNKEYYVINIFILWQIIRRDIIIFRLFIFKLLYIELWLYGHGFKLFFFLVKNQGGR